MADWYDVETLRDEWISAPLEDELIEQLLDVAKGDVMAYAFTSDRTAYEEATEEEPFDVPERLRYAQKRQVENLWNAGRVDPNGSIGPDGQTFTMTPHPLDWHIKQIIRPRRAVPHAR